LPRSNPDAIVQTALATAQAKGITRSEDTLLPAEIEAARAQRVAAACAPFDQPALRDEIETPAASASNSSTTSTSIRSLLSGFSEQAEAQAKG
jgi:type I restriction enzyme R subunit